MNYLSFYFDDVVGWDLVLKDPFERRTYPKMFKRGKVYSMLHIRNETDIKVAKYILFLNQLLGNNLINFGLKKEYIRLKGYSAIRKVLCSVIIFGKLNLFFVLEGFRDFIFENIIKKRIPLGVYLLPKEGILRFMVKDIGELGFFNSKYDFFGWQDYCFFDFYFRLVSLRRLNLFISYLNFDFRK